MSTNSASFAKDVTERVDKVIESIRSSSPAERTSVTSAAVHTTTSPALLTSTATFGASSAAHLTTGAGLASTAALRTSYHAVPSVSVHNVTTAASALAEAERVERVLRSIRSQSPVHRSTNTSTIYATTSPVLRTAGTAFGSASANLRSSYVHTVRVPSVSVYNVASAGTAYNAAAASSAVSEINRIDTTCKALAAENELLRGQAYLQTGLVEENSRVREDLSKVVLENEVLRSENRKVADAELKVTALLRQSQDVSLALGQQAKETSAWKAKFGELEVGAARYRSLYEASIHENERLKAEVLELRGHIGREGLFRSEVVSLKAQNEELLALKLTLSQQLAFQSEELNSLRVNLSKIDVFNSQLIIAEQENAKLRSIISAHSESTLELRTVVQECDVLRSKITITESENVKLRGLISSQAESIVELKNVVVALEGSSAKLVLLEADNKRYREVIESQNHSVVEFRRKIEELNVTISQLRLEAGIIASLEEKLVLASRSTESFGRLISEKESIILSLTQEISALRLEVAVIAGYEEKLALAARSTESFGRLISEKESIIIALNSELASLRLEVGVIAALEEKLALVSRSTESYTRIISEKEALILALNRDVASLRLEISGLNSQILSLNASIELSANYSLQIQRLIVESDELKVKLAHYINIEQQLLLVQKDKESWSLSMSAHLETIAQLNLRISSLEGQLFALDELKAKISLVVAENERLTLSAADQAKIVLEWSEKYYSLEKLYLAVKESTVQLEAIKTKFQNAVKETEVSQSTLRASYYGGYTGSVGISGAAAIARGTAGYVKTNLHESKYSVGSEVKTAGTPSELLIVSPVTYRAELNASPVVVRTSYSRTNSPGRF